MYRAAFVVGYAVLQGLAWLLADRIACRLIGHDPSWTIADACGFERPVCARCRRPL